MVFLVAACLTWYVYPLHYYDLVDTQQVAVDALILRDVLMIFLAVLLLGERQTGAGIADKAQFETLPASG